MHLLQDYAVAQDNSCVKLNQNESPSDLPPEVKEEILARLRDHSWNRYPTGNPVKLISSLAEYTGFPSSGIIVGNGSNELIQAVVCATCTSDDLIVTVRPGFPIYKRLAAVLDIPLTEVPLKEDFNFDTDALIKAGKDARLCILASPNNPTGNALSLEQIERIAAQTEGLVVIDEAYFEFHKQTAAPLIAQYQNLIILRTFSKAFRMAGLRLGYLLGQSNLVHDILKTRLPFSVGVLPQIAGQLLLSRRDLLEKETQVIIRERERVFHSLTRIPGIRPYPSRANFILFACLCFPGGEVFTRLRKQGVLVRFFSEQGMENLLRVTIGTPAENDVFLDELEKVCRGRQRESQSL